MAPTRFFALACDVVASPRNDEGFAARPSQTRTARARAMARGKSTTRGVGRVACAFALALALACAPTRARAQAPSPKTKLPAASGVVAGVEADPQAVETAPQAVISLPVVLAPVPDLYRDDEAGVAARARLREAHAPRKASVAEDRGAPGVSRPLRRSPDETVEKTFRDAGSYAYHDDDPYSTSVDASSNCYSKECVHAIHGQPTIGAGSPLPYPKVVRGVSAPQCLLNHPPTCTCFGPFTYVRPWGYYCVLVPPKDTPSPPPPMNTPSSPPPMNTSSPPPSPPKAQCGGPPVGFTCDVSPSGVDPCGVGGLGLCVFVDGVRSCCCDAECETVFGDCCADKRSCCDERRTVEFGKRRETPASSARIEARARRRDD